MTDALNPLDIFLQDTADQFSDRVALSWIQSQETLTYRELAQKVRTCATGLAQIRVGSGSHVAVMLPSCPAGSITWFALARLGAVLTPVNPTYTLAELAFVLKNSDAEFLIIDASLTTHLDTSEVHQLALQKVIVHGAKHAGFMEWADLLASGSDGNAQPMSENGLFSIQYTSGTTGRPKGCMLTQEYWDHFRHGAGDEMSGLDIQSTMIWSPFFYMDAQWQMLLSMHIGATAHIVEKMSLTKLGDWLTQLKINYFSFPEPFIQSLKDNAKPQWPLKFVNTFAWRPHNIAKLRSMFGPIGRDAFGMTEVGGVAAAPVDLDVGRKAGSCGTVLDGCAIKIVGHEDDELGPDQVGELLVKTPQMLLGYYKDSQVTADSFDDEWFKTGDLASIDEDGFLYIRGRLKEMIKRSGENIAAREVETIILQHPAVQEVAVVGVADILRKEEVKAFIIVKDSFDRDESQCRSIIEHCRTHLAQFKCPRYLEFLDDLPRTATRKVAKHLLGQMPPVEGEYAWDRLEWNLTAATGT